MRRVLETSSGARSAVALSSVAAFCALSGCSRLEQWRQPEVAACEDFVRGKLKAPTTYRRAKSTVIDEKLSLESWNALQKVRLGAMSDQFQDMTKRSSDEGGVRSVLLEYDAENGFGVPMRGMEICKFLMSSFPKDEFEVKPDAESSKLARMIWQLEEDSTPEPMCCLPAAQLAVIDRSRDMKAPKE